MAQVPFPPGFFDELTPEEQRRYVARLHDLIGGLQVPEHHAAELAQRRELHERGGDPAEDRRAALRRIREEIAVGLKQIEAGQHSFVSREEMKRLCRAEAVVRKLETEAERLGVEPRELARSAIAELLTEPKQTLAAAFKAFLQRDAEGYQPLEQVATSAMTERVISDSNVVLGKPVVAGTRIPVEAIVERIHAGETVEQLLQAFPQLSREDVHAALAYGDPSESVPDEVWNEMLRRVDQYNRGNATAEDWRIFLAQIEEDLGLAMRRSGPTTEHDDAQSEYDFSAATRGPVVSSETQQFTVRLDPEIVEWFRRCAAEAAGSYHVLINAILREHVERMAGLDLSRSHPDTHAANVLWDIAVADDDYLRSIKAGVEDARAGRTHSTQDVKSFVRSRATKPTDE